MSDQGANSVRRHPAWREAIEQFLDAKFAYDVLVPEEWFWRAFGWEVPDRTKISGEKWDRLRLKFLDQFNNLRQCLLRDHNIHLASVIGKGYRVLPPAEQTEAAFVEGMTEVGRAIAKMKTRLEHTEFDKLTAEQQLLNIRAQNQTGMIAASFKLTRKMPRLKDVERKALETRTVE